MSPKASARSLRRRIRPGARSCWAAWPLWHSVWWSAPGCPGSACSSPCSACISSATRNACRRTAPASVLAPADGRVISVDPAVPPGELGLGPAPRWRVGIFLSVLDVHVNRSAGRRHGHPHRLSPRHLRQRRVRQGGEDNERNAIAIRLPDGQEIAVVQIAGLIARRIVCATCARATRCGPATRFGIIRFGSRTDLYLPEGVHPLVREGQIMIGGETVIAELGVMSGTPRPGTDLPPAASRRCGLLQRRLRPRSRPRFKGPSFNRLVPEHHDAAGLVRRADRHALRAGRPLRRRRGGHLRRRGDRRAGRAARTAAEGHLAFRRRVRQPGRLPVLRRRAGLRAVSLVASPRRRLRLHPLHDVRGLHGAAPGTLQRRIG